MTYVDFLIIWVEINVMNQKKRSELYKDLNNLAFEKIKDFKI